MTDQLLPEDYIVITMLKVILRSESIEKNYPGGWSAFAERYELEADGDEKPSSIPLTSMSYEDLNITVDELIEKGLTPGADFAVADARRGVLEECDGIEFEEKWIGDESRGSYGLVVSNRLDH
jgi:hypothetical protein